MSSEAADVLSVDWVKLRQLSETSNGITLSKKSLRLRGFDVNDLPDDQQVKVLVREDGTGEFDLDVDHLENHHGEEQADIPILRG